MNINDLIDDLAAALAFNVNIAGWASEYYDTTHTVFVSRNNDALPSEDEMPCIVVYPLDKLVGRMITKKEHLIGVECWIQDNTRRTRDGYDNIVEYTGTKKIEAFRKLAETAAAGIDVLPVTLGRVEVEYDVISMFPFFLAVMGLNYVQESVPMGEDRLL